MKIVTGLLLTALLVITAGCSSHEDAKQPAGDETIQLTTRSAKSELFMEYAPLKPGRKKLVSDPPDPAGRWQAGL